MFHKRFWLQLEQYSKLIRLLNSIGRFLQNLSILVSLLYYIKQQYKIQILFSKRVSERDERPTYFHLSSKSTSKQLITIMNRIVPKTVPCGTTPFTGLKSEVSLLPIYIHSLFFPVRNCFALSKGLNGVNGPFLQLVTWCCDFKILTNVKILVKGFTDPEILLRIIASFIDPFMRVASHPLWCHNRKNSTSKFQLIPSTIILPMFTHDCFFLA